MADLIPDDLDEKNPVDAAALAQLRGAYRPSSRKRSDREIVAAMAAVMIERATGDGACTDEHLMAGGFTREEIECWRGQAAALAARVTADRVRAKIKAAKTRRGGKHAVVS